MSISKIISELAFMAMGIIAIVVVVHYDFDKPWLFFLGVGIIGWSCRSIYKEIRDSTKNGDISKMAKEREDIINKLGGED